MLSQFSLTGKKDFQGGALIPVAITAISVVNDALPDGECPQVPFDQSWQMSLALHLLLPGLYAK